MIKTATVDDLKRVVDVVMAPTLIELNDKLSNVVQGIKEAQDSLAKLKSAQEEMGRNHLDLEENIRRRFADVSSSSDVLGVNHVATNNRVKALEVLVANLSGSIESTRAGLMQRYSDVMEAFAHAENMR